jgi:hypothetical protein
MRCICRYEEADLLDRQGRLRPGLPADRAADMWTLCAQVNFDVLIGERDWSHRE